MFPRPSLKKFFRFFTAAYISLETVVIEDNGRVSFQPIPEDRELEVVYLAPELQEHGVVTEKVGRRLPAVESFHSPWRRLRDTQIDGLWKIKGWIVKPHQAE